MKTLKESLLDDIDAQIDDQTSLIESWLKENIIRRDGNYIFDKKKGPWSIDENNKVNVDGVIDFYLKDGIIPDFIKWGDVSNGVFWFHQKINSFKNFPTQASGIFIVNGTKTPKDFTTLGKVNLNGLYINTESITSIKGLKGYIGQIEMEITNSFEVFDANSNLQADTLILKISEYTKLQEIKNMPSNLKTIIFRNSSARAYRPGELSDSIYLLCKTLINQNAELKKLFKGKLLKSRWNKYKLISTEI